jgi:hypothetical protein
MINNIDEIIKIDFQNLLETNSFDVQQQKYDNLTYITIDNFFKNPNDIVDTLKLFPLYDKTKFYERLSERQEVNKLIEPTGFQQYFPNNYFDSLSYLFYKLLAEHDYVPYDIQNSPDAMEIGSQLQQFVYYSNIFYPGMLATGSGNYPHFDHSKFAFNIFLSQNVGGGTAFYNLRHKDKTYSSINELVAEENRDIKIEIRDKLNDMNNNKSKPFIAFDGDEIWEKYHTIDYEFNRLCLYQGHNWHNIYYDSTKETDVRYSLSATYEPAMKDK